MPFEKTHDMNYVGSESSDKGLADLFCYGPTEVVIAFARSDRRERIPDADVFHREEILEFRAQRLDSMCEHTVQNQYYFVGSSISDDRLRESQGIAAYPPVTASGLRPLHVKNDFHGLFSLYSYYLSIML